MPPVTDTSRRAFVAGLGALAFPRLALAGQQGATPGKLLPVRTPKIDHLDVIVPNVETSARFYMGLFNTTLHAQPFQGGFRYFVLFGDLPAATRQIGYLAIGDSRGRGTYIGHFCTSVFDYRRDAMAISAALDEAVAKEGLGKIGGRGGIGGIFSDPDGIEIQFLPAPDTLVTAAVPSDLVPPHKGLVTPLGVDHVLLHVADLDKGTRFYRILYGTESLSDRTTGRVWFQIGDTRLGLQQTAAGQKPHIETFGIKVKPFDAQKVAAGVTALGARVIPTPYEPGIVRLVDPDGISLEIVASS
jgi:catechol 2,3-dioxygenase-like lactoylglutathione lyase family enzyme